MIYGNLHSFVSTPVLEVPRRGAPDEVYFGKTEMRRIAYEILSNQPGLQLWS